MVYIKRTLDLKSLLQKKSYFLFGPRGTGKSFLIRQELCPSIPVINLLRSELYLRLTSHPEELESIITSYENHEIVVIDEVQRIPLLLNEVHRLIEEKQIKFLLTGSSARKLKRGGANLLAGRAREARLFPLTYHEIPEFSLAHYLLYGGLPMVYISEAPQEDLYAYIDTYLKDEIIAEAVVLKLQAFSRFLEISALTSGTMINYANISNDVGISASTIREYYGILEDTFLGFTLPAYTKTKKRKAISTAKFYYFDLGIRNALVRVDSVPLNTDLFGQLFEHFIALELRAYLSYRRIRKIFSYWQSINGQKVDFIIGDDIAIEVKSSNNIQQKHLNGLKALSEEAIFTKYILISQDKINRNQDKILILYWEDFLKRLWNDEIVMQTNDSTHPVSSNIQVKTSS
jgi:predicted AAA+ superfamily ATPase